MQDQGYGDNHSTRINLLIHLLAVPLFWLATAELLFFVAITHWSGISTALLALAVSMALQSIGHRSEAVAPRPFSGPVDFIQRILLEQFVRFPRFLLNGHFLQQWRREAD